MRKSVHLIGLSHVFDIQRSVLYWKLFVLDVDEVFWPLKSVWKYGYATVILNSAQKDMQI